MIHSGKQLNDTFSPLILHLSNPGERSRFDELVRTEFVFVNDDLPNQLKELLKSRHPTRVLSADDYEQLIKAHVGGCPMMEYGVWVYYPWNHSLVHTLDEAEFVEVRTSRNQYKITLEEQQALAKRKVGVIGLSVGQSVAVTMAMERACGELRLADFDVLELTNLNRIRTGIRNLGLKKVISVAREIAEIDPYFKVYCYPDGITEENIDTFYTGHGKLDLVIDECDGLDVKILCRQRAKAMQIPVVMEASDRGTIDIERFDLDPNRPILHGFIDHLDVSRVKHLKTNEEKVPYLLPIAGAETISTRAKASMMEVGQTITTWPQLASAVTMGGGMVTDVVRRIFLDEYRGSGRFFIDMDDLISDERNTIKQQHEIRQLPGTTAGDMVALIARAAVTEEQGQISPSEEQLSVMVEAAGNAPSGGNAQPWRWRFANGNLYLFIHSDYGPKLIDFRETASFVALGAATENLVIKAHELGLEIKTERFPLGADSQLVAIFRFFEKNAAVAGMETHVADDLAPAIPLRVANRQIVPRREMTQDQLDMLVSAARSVPGAELRLLTNERDIQAAAGIIAAADRMRVMHKEGHLEFLAEIRWTAEEAERTRTGIDINTLELTPSEMAGFNIARNWPVIEYLNKWGKGSGLERLSKKTAAAASAIGLITMPEYSIENFFEGGRAVERVWLSAAKERISFQPMSVSTFLFGRHRHEAGNMPAAMRNELGVLRKEFERLFAINDKFGEILVFRVFLSEQPAKRSLRIAVKDVLSFS